MLREIRKLNLVMITMAVLSGCASKPPAAISKVPPENLSLTRVRMDIENFIGAEVRWGGVISKIENRATHTWIELVRRKLRDDGKPATDGRSDGRFIASFEGFVDPVVYEVGRPLTVVGRIEAGTKRPIGDYDYLFPIVAVEGSYLWKAASEYRDRYYPPPYWYYDLRFYRPWPYHHPRYHW